MPLRTSWHRRPRDGRLSLSRQPDQHFDILVLDAFSGYAIPIHLLTAEAFALYQRHLAAGGAIAIDLTNRHLDLAPPVRAGARSSTCMPWRSPPPPSNHLSHRRGY